MTVHALERPRKLTNEAGEVRFEANLTNRTARYFCRMIARRFAETHERLTLNLQDVKTADVVGLAALVQAATRAARQGIALAIVPSPALHHALLAAGLLDELPLDGGRPSPGPAGIVPAVRQHAPTPYLACTERLGLRQPTWEELPRFAEWAREPLLEQMVGSRLLYLCRHLGPYHPDFVPAVLHDPTSLTLFIEPLASPGNPVGFVRLYDVHLVERFAFLETAVTQARSLRAGAGIEASRLLLAWAMDTLEIRRVEAKVFAYNVLSINSLRRNGFQQEGVLRQAKTYEGQRWDIVVFSILEEEMHAQRQRDGFPHMGLWP